MMQIIKPNKRITPEEIQKIKEIPIVDFLSKIDIHPQKIRGNEYWYLSPLRDEKTPSFSVSILKNVWVDFGATANVGGDIIDLAKLIIHTKDFKEAIDYIGVIMSLTDGQFKRQDNKKIMVDEGESHTPKIKKIKKLENRALVEYLESRCIPLAIAQEFCREIYYSIGNKNYFGIAFPNVAESGYEVRNKYCKISTSKDITFLPGSANDLFIYEGFFDFLSHQELFRLDGYTGKLPYADSIILNSVSNYDKSIGTIAQYSKVCVFLDNDDAGKKLIEKYNHLCADFGCICEDHSSLYAPHKDLNEFLISKATQLK